MLDSLNVITVIHVTGFDGWQWKITWQRNDGRWHGYIHHRYLRVNIWMKCGSVHYRVLENWFARDGVENTKWIFL